MKTESEVVMQTLELDGKRYVVVPEEEYRRLAARGGEMPAMPKVRGDGTMPALEAIRAGLARRVVAARGRAGWSQAELARRAKVRVETLNRIERAKVTPDAATMGKVERALRGVGVEV